MNDLDKKLSSALRVEIPLSENKLDRIRKETREMYEKEKATNQNWTVGFTIAGFVAAALWFYLFWNSESTKFQILWASLLVGEGLGISILYIGHIVTENSLTDRKEHREIELKIAELEERLLGSRL